MNIRIAAILIASCLATSNLVQAQTAIVTAQKSDVFRPKTGRFSDASGMAAPGAPVAAETRAVAPTAIAPIQAPKISFELRASDLNLKNAFLRWGEEHRQQVIWRLANEVPLDALGTVSATSLADALTQVAIAFQDKKEPFVVREWDNAIVIIPQWAARP